MDKRRTVYTVCMIRVGVIRGGTGESYGDSLASGAYVLRNLPRERYEPVDVFVDKEGVWHLGGKPVSSELLRSRIDVAWNALDGFYGADGKLAQTLESLAIPYVGSSPLSSAITMHKRLAREQLAKLGLKTPRGVYVEAWDGEREEAVASVAGQVARDFSPPWLVEPISRGFAKAPIRAKTRDGLTAVLLQMFDANVPVLIEEEVLGKSASVSATPNFRGQDLYTFVPGGYSGGRDKTVSDALQKAARAVHEGMKLGHYSRIEAIVSPKGQVYVTKVDTVPTFAPGSDLHAALEGVGASFGEFADHCIGCALDGGRFS